jgi:putative PIN family toxin of toxin-antitoxin system
MVRVVLDTSVLVSAIRSGRGAAAEVVRLAFLGRLVLLLDYKLVCEYRDVALRPEHLDASGRSPSEVEEIIEALEAVATPVFVSVQYRPLSADADDDMVLDVAINGGADVVVTNNLRDFLPALDGFGIEVATPSGFLTMMRQRKGLTDADQ